MDNDELIELRMYFLHLSQMGDIEVLQNALCCDKTLESGFDAFKEKSKESC